MNKFGADLDRLVEHLLDASPHILRLRVCQLDENLEKFKRVPCVPLHVCSKRFDGWTGDGYIVDGHDSLARKLDKVERVGWQ